MRMSRNASAKEISNTHLMVRTVAKVERMAKDGHETETNPHRRPREVADEQFKKVTDLGTRIALHIVELFTFEQMTPGEKDFLHKKMLGASTVTVDLGAAAAAMKADAMDLET